MRLSHCVSQLLDETVAACSTYRCVVNGTCEDDWRSVLALCEAHDSCLPSLGLHPWRVGARAPGWDERLEGLLVAHPRAAIGEAGLDSSAASSPLPDQLHALSVHLRLAARLRRPVSLHLPRAVADATLAALRRDAPPSGFERGVLLHSYGGSAAQVPAFAALGCVFSFSATVTVSHRSTAALRSVPDALLLVETDAPDGLSHVAEAAMPQLVTPRQNVETGKQSCSCADSASEARPQRLNHPVRGHRCSQLRWEKRRLSFMRINVAPLTSSAQANILSVISHVANIRECTPAEIAAMTSANGRRIFGTVAS